MRVSCCFFLAISKNLSCTHVNTMMGRQVIFSPQIAATIDAETTHTVNLGGFLTFPAAQSTISGDKALQDTIAMRYIETCSTGHDDDPGEEFES